MKWILIVLAVIVVAAAAWYGLSGERTRALNVIGSTSVQPFAEMLAEIYNRQGSDCIVDVQGGGSTAGLQAAANGIADIGMCSRSLKAEEEEKFTPIVIARDGLAIVVHPTNSVDNLTREQVRRMFAGEIADWREVGGRPGPIRLITREEGSGTREAFSKLVMDNQRIARRALTQESNMAVKELVAHDPAAVGYMSLGLVGGLKTVRIDGVSPTVKHVIDGSYPLVRPFLFVTTGPPNPRARKFIAFVLSAAGQALLEREGLVRAMARPAAEGSSP